MNDSFGQTDDVLRILVVNDTPEIDHLLVDNLNAHDGAVIVGTANSVPHAISIAHAREAQVILHVLNSARSLLILKSLMQEVRLPIVGVAATDELGKEAMKIGVVELVKESTRIETTIQTLTLMSRIPVVRRSGGSKAGLPMAAHASTVGTMQRSRMATVSGDMRRIVVIGASTGGPNALATLLGRLTSDFPAPILVAQHMPDDFPNSFAEWLNNITELNVVVAETGMEAKPGNVYISPAVRDLVVVGEGYLQTRKPADRGPRPCVDRLFSSASQLRGILIYGVLLTGMGRDGSKGLDELRKSGAETVVQDSKSSAVNSMPQSALDSGAAQFAWPPNIIGDQLSLWAMGKTKVG